MKRRKEFLKALDELDIDYNEVETGEIIFNYGGGNYWCILDGPDPDYVTVNKMENRNTVDMNRKQQIFSVANEINIRAPGIKAIVMGEDVLLNCDLYSGRHRLCLYDMKAVLTRLKIAEIALNKLLNIRLKEL